MQLTEQAIQYVEEQIPGLAEQATSQAYWHTLAAGDSVVVALEGKLWEVFPDGTRQFIKTIAAPVSVEQRHFTIPQA